MNLFRNPEHFIFQDRFGSANSEAGTRGNCFQVCLSILMGLPLNEVPHFYDTDEDLDTQHRNVALWLHERGWFRMWFEYEVFVKGQFAGVPWIGSDALVLLSGQSPRFPDSSHVVIARFNGPNKWELVHDPNPEGKGFDKDPDYVEIIAPLPRHV